MLLQIPGVLGKPAVAELRRALDAAPWVDGNVTSGPQAALAKRNRQLPQDSSAARAAGAAIVAALEKSPLFMSAALPHTILPPLFNRYGVGEGFGSHIDNAVRMNVETGRRIRTGIGGLAGRRWQVDGAFQGEAALRGTIDCSGTDDYGGRFQPVSSGVAT